MKRLGDILKSVEVLEVSGEKDIQVSGITFDSRAVMPGMVFVAVRGTTADGHDFIPQAVSKDAGVVVCEKVPEEKAGHAVFVRVIDSARALGVMASNYFDNPSSHLKLVGITGTNGKTTTVTLLYRLFMALGYKTGCLSTIRNYVGRKIVGATHTTPDPVQLNSLLKDMADAGCQYAFMEVSSHALAQQRVAGLAFAGGIFSNITHDHLDYHKTFEEYIRAKKLFFDNLPDGSFALINNDDRNGKVMVQNTRAAVHYYGIKSMAGFKARIIESHVDGMLLNIDQTEIWTRFLGAFNASNLLAVYATARLLKQAKEDVLKIMSQLEPVEGRFQSVKSEDGVTAIVDYAHTPDALANVLATIRQIKATAGQIITVVGAGGNRDRTKRPGMARVAADMSDRVILTSDNPRDEDPEAIISDMKEGLDKTMTTKVIAIADRKEAVKTACMMAKSGDVLLIAGKGHEEYQEIKGVKYPFSDKELVMELLKIKSTNLH
ncbi:MAG: UDP-N-acetylmuramoyl-L-alanyl-D-glutamate--2,6-diaminopimelate ligase [Bacteroidales bacterium]|nr:UDP-N-acetylmuramoyl-L-alanyl-D-glutamate--2,6-diaminopimelate ligase [Bacteroidales bacterium]MBN2761832.1 UDP-N-acetylmuramoyl-L-alanyl-D-glutamate--2,6-diaminopimelate ligase [Bacteroidales bacterium]